MNNKYVIKLLLIALIALIFVLLGTWFIFGSLDFEVLTEYRPKLLGWYILALIPSLLIVLGNSKEKSK